MVVVINEPPHGILGCWNAKYVKVESLTLNEINHTNNKGRKIHNRKKHRQKIDHTRELDCEEGYVTLCYESAD